MKCMNMVVLRWVYYVNYCCNYNKNLICLIIPLSKLWDATDWFDGVDDAFCKWNM